MDPMTLLLMGLGGAGLSGLGTLLQGAQPYQDTTAGWLKGFNKQIKAPEGNRDLNWANSSRLTDALWGSGSLNPQAYLQKATGYSNNAADIYNQLQRGYGAGGPFSAQGMQQSFYGMQPEMRSLAQGIAEDSTSRAGQSMEAAAAQASSRALRNMQNQMGSQGLFGAASGPVAASLSYGAQEPLMQAQTAINQMYGQNYMGAYNPMAAFGMQNIQSMPAALGNIGQLYAGLADQQYGAANPLLSLLGDQSQQVLMAPDLQQRKSALASILSGLGNFGMQAGSFGLGQGWNGSGKGLSTGSDLFQGWGLNKGQVFSDERYYSPWAVSTRGR